MVIAPTLSPRGPLLAFHLESPELAGMLKAEREIEQSTSVVSCSGLESIHENVLESVGATRHDISGSS